MPAIVSSSVGSSRSGGSAPSSAEASNDVINGDVLKISCTHQDEIKADLTLHWRCLLDSQDKRLKPTVQIRPKDAPSNSTVTPAPA